LSFVFGLLLIVFDLLLVNFGLLLVNFGLLLIVFGLLLIVFGLLSVNFGLLLIVFGLLLVNFDLLLSGKRPKRVGESGNCQTLEAAKLNLMWSMRAFRSQSPTESAFFSTITSSF